MHLLILKKGFLGTEYEEREVAIGCHKLKVTVELEKSRFSEMVGRKP